MKSVFKNKLPKWYKNINLNDKIVITNDIDALLSHHFLHKKFKCEIGGFYDFNNLYFTDCKDKNFIGVDLDCLKGRTFGNHFTYFYKNEDAINLNNCYKLKYHQKYPLNTVLLILSLYDFDIETMTDEQLAILLSIDSAYRGYYTDNEYFKNIYLKWLDMLDIGFLKNRILKHMTPRDFADIAKRFNLNGTIKVNKNGRLSTNIKLDELSQVFDDDIQLPQDKFNLHSQYQYLIINPNKQAIPPREKIISMAWTRKNQLRMSVA